MSGREAGDWLGCGWVGERLGLRVRWPTCWVVARAVLAVTLGLMASLGLSSAQASQAPVSQVRVVARFPHDPNAFTQGLVITDGELYEGTGGYGESVLRRVDLKTGRVLAQVELSDRWFGEGITDWQDELIQLTWRAGVGLRYDKATLEPLGRFSIRGEGWGLTHDGRHWIMSDGSAELRFLDPADGRELRRLRVMDGPKPVRRLNELEYVGGEVWANLWYEDRLVRIDPATGQVLGYVDLGGLWPDDQPRRHDQVLNGIAVDPQTGDLFVTGKRWPWLYQIEVVESATD